MKELSKNLAKAVVGGGAGTGDQGGPPQAESATTPTFYYAPIVKSSDN